MFFIGLGWIFLTVGTKKKQKNLRIVQGVFLEKKNLIAKSAPYIEEIMSHLAIFRQLFPIGCQN